MTSRLLGPSSTIAVILGAYDWSRVGLPEAPSFRRTAGHLHAYLLAKSPYGLSLEPDFVINLFNDPSAASAQLKRINDELKALIQERRSVHPIEDILIYYIGHGTGEAGKHLHLLIRDSFKGIEEQSSIAAPALAHVLRVAAPQQRRIVILDCCFSEAAADAFGGMGAFDSAVAATAAKDLHPEAAPPQRGTVVFSSSPRGRASVGKPGAQRTLFTGALLKVLQEGSPARASSMLSFANLRDDVFDQMIREYPDPPRPALHQPDQREGDLTAVPAFPNIWRTAEEHRKAEEARLADELSKVEEARRAEEQRRAEAAARLAEEKRKLSIHDQRFALVVGLSMKLEKIRSQLERLIDGKISQEEVAPHGEIQELTEVYENLRVLPVILGAELSSLLEEKAKVASVVASRWEPLKKQRSDGNTAELDKHWVRWVEITDQLSSTITELREKDFRHAAGDPARLMEEQRKAEEARQAEEHRKAEEAARLAEEKRKADEAARAAEEHKVAEAARLADERRKAEEASEAARLAEEKRQAEEPERQAQARRALRSREVPRSALGQWTPPADRSDPVELLIEQGKDSIQELLPIRYRRMLASPFAFLRGAAAVMAADLARTPTTGIRIQACGDAHLANFGSYATSEGLPVFDILNFDETLPAPFEWDLKRLATSLVVAARVAGCSEKAARSLARTAAQSYREHMASLARLRPVDVWNVRVDFANAIANIEQSKLRVAIQKRLARAMRSGTKQNDLDLVEEKSGDVRIRDVPPLVYHLSEHDLLVREVLTSYAETLQEDRQTLLRRYTVRDVAFKVVGISGIGTFCAIGLLTASDGSPLLLQIKEAQESVLAPFAGTSNYANHGERVVVGQRMMQAATDIFLGWTPSPVYKRYFYVRRLRDSLLAGLAELQSALPFYASLCGLTLARAHGRAGDPALVSGYAGSGTALDEAIAEFAVAYADQTEKDWNGFLAAIKAGRMALRE